MFSLSLAELKPALDVLRRAHVNALIMSRPGTGKDACLLSYVKQVRKLIPDYKIWQCITSTKDPTDIGGLPGIVNDEVVFRMLQELPWDTQDKGVIVFEELDRTRPPVLNTMPPIWWSGKLHGHTLSPNAWICATINGVTDIGTSPLPEAIVTRSCILPVFDGDADSAALWDSWADTAGIHPICRFIRSFSSDSYLKEPEWPNLPKPNNRTLELASRIMFALDASEKVYDAKLTEKLTKLLLAGVVGNQLAVQMKGLYAKMKSVEAPATLMKGTGPLPTDLSEQIKKDPGVGFILFASLSSMAGTTEEGDRVIELAQSLPQELQGWVYRKIGEKLPDCNSNAILLEHFTDSLKRDRSAGEIVPLQSLIRKSASQ